MSGSQEVIHSGYLTKHGAVVKNWKLRYMVLCKNGKLLYYKKPPQDWTKEDPKGELDVQSDVVGLTLWDESKEKGLVKWSKEAIPYSGFCMHTRQGRLWSVHAESPQACDEWIKAIRLVGANIRRSTVTEAGLKKREQDKAAAAAASSLPAADKDADAAAPSPAPEDGGEDNGAPKKYVHKVIGGMVVKVENTEWKYEK
mmetsp:Transcript_22852/g.59616  ORF Transcript_22852/g.59616 Transcript_22852/m.59616 type:complete len:199 (+) Transcript_22852:327-923(+)|eukprot:CAMPEP_0182916312 /NCGR_PEP_ID=MMETSP0105_2-20130417/858_1 /TAXON_ID=81532 ORGANISM="Acanthoeca-like sp., Strain 10tr" /NCGR_SAMPLE_ID=MMETSP0105_2 /ASSEMBLY_ACC=CAM_ASM_000205 /LENGTH=198 /DNA_ID=CAMNT_0025053249 /DNA_START=237 /DNA_END=833 /DNA_ORIENTATION=-